MDRKELEVRASDLRVEINKAALSEDADAEKLRELRSEYENVETRLAALATLEAFEPKAADEIDPEERELRATISQANLGRIFQAALETRAIDGVERELQEHFGLAPNQVPLEMLRDDLEIRTSGVTPAPTDVGQAQRPIIPAVFPQAAATFLGLRQDTVGVGEAVYAVLSTSATPGTPAEGADQAHSTAGFTAKVLAPSRIQASLFYSREDRARFAGMAEALRMNLSDALADKLDEVVLDKLVLGNTLTANNASAADTYASYRKRFVYDRIDGKYAAVAGEVRMVVGAKTYGDMAATYRSDSDSMNALGAIMAETGGVRVSAHMPAVASDKQNALVRRGMRRDFAIGIWQGVSLIVDEVTQAKAGEIVLTAVMLHAVDLLRADGFAKVQAQHA